MIDASYADKAKQDGLKEPPKRVSMEVSVPSVAPQSSEERKGEMTMDALLASYEQDLDIEPQGSLEGDESQIAAGVNLLKQVSEQQMDIAIKREQSLSQGEAIDRYMPTNNVLIA